MELSKRNDDLSARLLLRLSAHFGNNIYNFKGLWVHKSKYRGIERPLYRTPNSLMMANNLYMTSVSADITHSYFPILGQLVRGMFAANTKGKSA